MAYREVCVVTPDPREGHDGTITVYIKADLEEIVAAIEPYEHDIRTLYLDSDDTNPQNDAFSALFELLLKETQPFIEMHKKDGLHRLLVFTMLDNIREGREMTDFSGSHY